MKQHRQTLRLILMIGAAVVIGAVVGNQVDRLALGAGLGAAAGIGAGASWKAGEAKRTVRETAETDLDALNAYVDGKMKRYTLLFAVNGGAFAVGQFLLNDDGTQLKAILPLRYLAEGAIVYTAIMTVDIWLFGQMMRERFVGDAAFTAAGKALLILIGILLMGGWLLIDLRAPR